MTALNIFCYYSYSRRVQNLQIKTQEKKKKKQAIEALSMHNAHVK